MTIIRPSLLLDFANARQLDPRLTLSRLGAAHRTTRLGQFSTAPSGMPRFHHAGLSGRSLGLLVENQRTNLLLRSAEFDNATWAKNLGTITPNAIASPDGTISADLFVEDTSNGQHQISQAYTYATATPYILSWGVKKAAGTRRAVLIMTVSAGGFVTGTFDLNTKTVTLNSGGTNPFTGAVGYVEELPDGFFIISIAATSGATAGAGFAQLRLDNGTTSTYTGDGASGLYSWGADLKASLVPSTHVPTTSAQVTVPADDVSMALGADVWCATEGSILVRARSPRATPPSGSTQTLLYINDNTANERIALLRNSASQLLLQIVDGAVTQANMNLGDVPNDTDFAVALRYRADDIAASLNGATPLTDASATLPTVTMLRAGNGNAGESWGATIAKIAVFPRGFTNAELQQLAA